MVVEAVDMVGMVVDSLVAVFMVAADSMVDSLVHMVVFMVMADSMVDSLVMVVFIMDTVDMVGNMEDMAGVTVMDAVGEEMNSDTVVDMPLGDLIMASAMDS